MLFEIWPFNYFIFTLFLTLLPCGFLVTVIARYLSLPRNFGKMKIVPTWLDVVSVWSARGREMGRRGLGLGRLIVAMAFRIGILTFNWYWHLTAIKTVRIRVCVRTRTV